MSVLAEIAAERQRQDEQWGGPSHDDDHDYDEWARIIEKHEIRLTDLLRDDDAAAARGRAIVVAALAVALVESIDRYAKVSEDYGL